MTIPSNNTELQAPTPGNVFTKILQKEISIRSSLILFYLVLISFISITTISVTQHLLGRVLVDLSNQIIQRTGEVVQQRIEDYLDPLTYNLHEVANLIKDDIIVPDASYQFKHYLFELVNPLPQVFGAYWATPQGDFFGIKREEDNIFEIWNIEQGVTPPRIFHAEMHPDGKIYNIKVKTKAKYDPRTRPWYMATIKNKEIVTSIYKFALFKSQSVYPYGITAAQAVYDDKNNLRGVFGLDIIIDKLIEYIKKINVSKNGIILVTDRDNNLIAEAGNIQLEKAIGQQVTPALLQKLKIPNHLFQQKDTTGTVHKYSGSPSYFVIQKNLPQMSGDWTITIIVPENDILGTLKIAELISFLSAILALIIGVLIANMISQRITRPIIGIVREAEAIQNLELEKIIIVPTNIKEIRVLTAAFETMKKALQSFERYVPTHLIKMLFESGTVAQVGGETRVLTILFADIKNFTPLIEKSPPKQVMKFLYEYLDAMTKVVYGYHGTIDKYVGDLIMAFWGAPLIDGTQADHACGCALKMLETLNKLNQKWTQQGFEEIAIRIGINSGPALVGNVGSSERLNYTAMGDSVNLASRLEAVNKIYGTNVLITSRTLRALKTHFNTRLVDCVRVRGKNESVKIYELLPADFPTQDLEIFNTHFADAFSLYQQGQWEKAHELFKNLERDFPHDKVVAVFVKRCELLNKNKPQHWDGVWRLD